MVLHSRHQTPGSAYDRATKQGPQLAVHAWRYRGLKSKARHEAWLSLEMPGSFTYIANHNRDASQMVVVGTDIPDVAASTLQMALAALQEHEAVVGPAHDGGYYLLGLRRPQEALFRGMEWSTSSVLRETVARAEAAGLRLAPLATLPTLQDIDDVEVRLVVCRVPAHLAHLFSDSLAHAQFAHVQEEGRVHGVSAVPCAEVPLLRDIMMRAKIYYGGLRGSRRSGGWKKANFHCLRWRRLLACGRKLKSGC